MKLNDAKRWAKAKMAKYGISKATIIASCDGHKLGIELPIRSLFEDGPALAASAGNIQTSGSIAAQPEHLGVYGVKKKVVTGIGKVNKGGKKQKRTTGPSLR